MTMAKVKICLDAGHYGYYNQSPAVKAYYESKMNWTLHLLLKKYLEQYGIEVILTRSNQATDLSLTSRGKASKGCDLFLSLHSNAADDESVDKPVVFVPLNGTGDKIGKLLAACIAEVMETKQPGEVHKRRGNNGDYYGVIRGAVSVGVPGLILEHSFHTNKRSTLWLLEDDNLDKMAKAEADVIAKYFGLTEEKETEEETKTEGEKTVNIELNVLKKGAKGEQVKTIQRLLLALGYSLAPYGVDGDFGSVTDKAVRAFQKAEGLSVDGIVGKNSWTALLK